MVCESVPTSVSRIIDAFFIQNTPGQVLEVDLMTDADSRRHHAEAVECPHSPLQKLVACAVALELHFHISAQGVGLARHVHLNRVINDQVHRHERFDHLRIATHLEDGGSHGSQIHEQGNAGEVLQQDARHRERNLPASLFPGTPVRQRADIFLTYLLSIVVAQDGLQHDADAHGEPGNRADTFGFQLRKRVILSGSSAAGGERLAGVEEVMCHRFSS